MRFFWVAMIFVGGLVVLSVGGCGDGSGAGGGERELLFYCGAGLSEPAEELVEVFGAEHGVKMVTDFAGSEMLLSKIKLGRSGDLYMPGDKHYVELAAGEGLIGQRRSVCYFVPTILVQKGNPKGIAGLRDLLKPGVKLGLGDARACAIGRKCKKIFEKNGIGWAEVEKNLKYQSLTVNDLGVQIEAKSLDAVVVWGAVARQFAQNGEAVSLPVAENVISTVDIGVLEFSENKELAEQFVEFVGSARGQAILEKHNYRTTEPGAG